MASTAFDSIPDGPVKERFRNQFSAAGQSIANRARQYEIGQRQQFEAGQQQGLLANLQQQAETALTTTMLSEIPYHLAETRSSPMAKPMARAMKRLNQIGIASGECCDWSS